MQHSSSSDQRLTPRQREAEDRRSRMTQRRDEASSRIRKAKKSTYLAQKRGLSSTSIGVATTITSSRSQSASADHFRSLLQSYFQDRSAEGLRRIQSAIASLAIAAPSNRTFVDNPLLILEQTDQELAKQFLELLKAQAVEAIPIATAPGGHAVTILCSILECLVQLTSLQHQPAGQTSFGKTSSDDNYYGSVPFTWVELIIDAGWLNVLGQATTTLQTKENAIKVTEYACIILGNIFGESRQYVPAAQKPAWISFLIQAVPVTPTSAAWALTNMIRNDHTSLASTYCSENLLSSSLLLQWLEQPSIATQTAWMIASLTAREPEVVLYLCRHLSFPSALVTALDNPVTPDQAEPLLEALGNIASNPSMVPPLLLQVNCPTLLPIVQRYLLQTPSTRQHKEILILTAWLAGCLLVDAGIESHPSTLFAAPLLVPILMGRLGSGRFDLKEDREFVSALWNAFSWPPDCVDHANESTNSESRKGPPPAVKAVVSLETLQPSTVQGLVQLVGSSDADAVVASVHVLSALLRWHDDQHTMQQSFVIVMQGESVPDVLERVCDSPLEIAAEVAADLLDDFFDEDALEGRSGEDSIMNDNYSWMQLSAPAGLENTFQPTPRVGFGGQGMGIGSTGTATTEPNSSSVNGLGRGRGRGAILPAWMS